MSLLAVLSVYMYILFRRERREAMALEGVVQNLTAPTADHGHAPAPTPAADHAPAPAPAADHGHGHAPAAPAHHAPMAPVPAKRKVGLVWRTAHLWLPIVAGFGGQAYLDLIKPMLEKSAG